MTKAVEAPPLC